MGSDNQSSRPGSSPDVTNLTDEQYAHAQEGDLAAQGIVDREVRQLATIWLKERGVISREDREDLVQIVALRLFKQWDAARGPVRPFLFGVLLPTLRNQYFRAAYQRQRALPPPPSPQDALEPVETMPTTMAEQLLRGRATFLSAGDQRLLKVRLSRPDWTARRVSETCGVSEATVSLVVKRKVPLEAMARWANGAGTFSAEDVGHLVRTLERWRTEGDLNTAGLGFDVLLSGFAAHRRLESLQLRDECGIPYILPVLVGRVQIALAQQELVYADGLLGQLEALLKTPELQRLQAWWFRLNYIRGRRQTAEFRYGDALQNYERVFTELPEHLWSRDGVFLHSVAVAHRGTENFKAARSFVDLSLEAYTVSGSIRDVAHTLSRKARICMEEGEKARSVTSLIAAEDCLGALRAEHPNFYRLSPIGYTQNLLHHLRFAAIVKRSADDYMKLIDEVTTLINRSGYLHEFLELEEICDCYDIRSAVRGLLIRFQPRQPRLGQRLRQRLKERAKP